MVKTEEDWEKAGGAARKEGERGEGGVVGKVGRGRGRRGESG